MNASKKLTRNDLYYLAIFSHRGLRYTMVYSLGQWSLPVVSCVWKEGSLEADFESGTWWQSRMFAIVLFSWSMFINKAWSSDVMLSQSCGRNIPRYQNRGFEEEKVGLLLCFSEECLVL
jgi:hypothetical protein